MAGQQAGQHEHKLLYIGHVGDQQTKERHMFSDICAVSIVDFPLALEGKNIHINVEKEGRSGFALTAQATPYQQAGRISLSRLQREWNDIVEDEKLLCYQFEIFECVSRVEFNISWASDEQAKRTSRPLDALSLTKVTKRVLEGHVLALHQKVLLRIEMNGLKYPIILRAVALKAFGVDSTKEHIRGVFSPETSMQFLSDTIQIHAVSSNTSIDSINRQNILHEGLGIGGLGPELQTILRRALASRKIPKADFTILGIKHVRGILLYGPPGTGKTLIARKISQILDVHEPKIVSGPEIMNKFVGQSERNLREVFTDAKNEDSERGTDSRLHLIIFDELDAICKPRGSDGGGGARVGDSIVNQLLTILDGVRQLGNVLVIGTTNRRDMIDEALLRPGRLEVLVEIGLPDRVGRLDILKIHTREMKSNGCLADDVCLERIADLTENYTGAELTGVINSAAAYAIERTRNIQIAVKLIQDDFASAVHDIQPSHGGDLSEIRRIIQWGVHFFAPWITELLEHCYRIAKTVQADGKLCTSSILLHGAPGSGTSTLAAKSAGFSGFLSVHMISPQRLVHCQTELAKIAFINSVFDKAARSKTSAIILDDITAIIGWNRLGPKYSINLLVTLEAHIRSVSLKGHRRLVIATTSDYEACQRLGLERTFDDSFQVRSVENFQELKIILLRVGAFKPSCIDDLCHSISERRGGDGFRLGIKHLLMCCAKSGRTAQSIRQTGNSNSNGGLVNNEDKPVEVDESNLGHTTHKETKSAQEIFLEMLLKRMN